MVFQCDKCKKPFGTLQNLTCHIHKKKKCDAVNQCPRCDKIFKTTFNYRRHVERKTSCDPMKGNPLIEVKDDMCLFCHVQCVSKKTLAKHYLTCKVKNGGVEKILVRVLAELNELKLKHAAPPQVTTPATPSTTNINNGVIINSHHNTVINIQLIDYGSFEHDTKFIELLKEKLPELLLQASRRDIGVIPQIQDRIKDLILFIYRNPNHLDLQNIYVLDPRVHDNSAFIFKDGEWHNKFWNSLLTEIIQRVRLHSHHVKVPDSTLSLTKHIELLSGDTDKKKEGMTIEQFAELCVKVGLPLCFDSITPADATPAKKCLADGANPQATTADGAAPPPLIKNSPAP